MADLDSEQLLGIRVIERTTLQGPVIYEVQSLWSTQRSWRTKAFTSKSEAMKYRNGLIEGLSASDNTTVVWQWYSNDHTHATEEDET